MKGFLWIELESPLCAGSGMARAGIVDREVSLDRAGLPVIGGRRLKGLLRDAWREVQETGHFPGMPEFEEAFGKPGGVGARLRIGAAVLPERNALRAFLDHEANGIGREEVVEQFTEIRRQTRIDRQTGAPQKDTLRATRTVRHSIAGKPLRFRAEVDCADPANFPHLERAAKALRQVGASRTRGLGFVRCHLEKVAEAPSPDVPSARPVAALKGDSPTVLPFGIRLHEPALLTSLEGDANFVATEQYIPGSAIQGAIAARFLGAPDFHRLICSGAVRFLAAFPEIPDEQATPHRAFPVPHSVRRRKDDESIFFNLASADSGDHPIRRARGWCLPAALYRDRRSPSAAVDTVFAYHHTRPADRRIGRAVGEKHEEYNLSEPEAGGVFAYEALAADQSFQGVLLGNASDLDRIVAALPDGSKLNIGRSRSAEYGGSATWTWLPPLPSKGQEVSGWKVGQAVPPVDPAPGGREFSGKPCGPCAAGPLACADLPSGQDFDPSSCSKLIVTLLAPMIARNQHGTQGPWLPSVEIEKALGLTQPCNGVRSWARTQWSGRYLSHQRLPRSQALALSPGSVFVLPLEPGTMLSQDNLNRVAALSFGCRTEEGFGRIALHTEADGHPALDAPARAAAPSVPNLPESARPIAIGILKKRIEDAASHAGRAWADTYAAGHLPNHLLGRLMRICANRTPGEAAAEIGLFRDGPKGKLQNLWIQTPAGKLSLLDLILRSLNDDPPALAEELAQQPWRRLFENQDPLAANTPWREHLRRTYVLSALRSMAWRNRERKEPGSHAPH